MEYNIIFCLIKKIESPQNQEYILEIEKDTHLKILPYKELDILIYKMEQIYYNMYIVIISDVMFPSYIEEIKNNKNLYSIPLTVIFKYKKENIKKNIDKKYLKYIEHKYYNILGVIDSYNELKDKIININNVINNNISKIILGDTPKEEYKESLIFEYIKNKDQLIFPYLFPKIMSKMKVDYNTVKKFNLFLLEKYGKNKKIKYFIKCLYICEDIPVDMIAKYWGKIYTLETSFHYNINYSLMKLKNEIYNPFIQIFYSGFKNYSYQFNNEDSNKEEILFKVTNISEKELIKIKNYFEHDNNNKSELGILIYTRTFLSFSIDLKSELKSMKNIPNTSKVLFKLENKYKNEYLNNIDFTKIYSRKENEVLFFPFSPFIIKSISKENDYYIIYLNYIGLFTDTIQKKIEKIENIKEIIEDISNNLNYSKDVLSSGIMINEIVEKDIDKYLEMNIVDNTFSTKEKIISSLLLEKIIGHINKNVNNNLIKLCLIKKNEILIANNIIKDFNMNLYEYNNIENVMKKFNSIEAEETLLILNDNIFPEYIEKIKNLKIEIFPLTIVYTSNPKEIKDNQEYSKYINHKIFNILGIVESYEELKQKIYEVNENILKSKLKIIIKNLEAKHIDMDEFKEEINTKFDNLYKDFEKKKEENNNNKDNNNKYLDEVKNNLINEINKIFQNKLNLNEKKDKDEIKNLLLYIYDQNENLNNFVEYINAVLENVFDYSLLKENDEARIHNYIVDFMKKDIIKKKEKKLKEKYKDNNIFIKFENFVNVIMEDNEERIFMENKAVEYILYKMKKSLIDKKINKLMDSFDMKIFLDYFDQKKKEVEEEKNVIKIGVRFKGPEN